MAAGTISSPGHCLGAADSTAQAASLDLGALLAEADAANPEVLASRARVRAAEHLPSQAEALPDPLARVSYTNEGLTDVTLGSSLDSVLAFSWEQEVPYPGKRKLAGNVARAEIGVGEGMLESARQRVRSGVKSAYAELSRLDRTRSLLEENRKLLESFRDATRSRYETGEGILENILKAQTELTKLDVELAGLAQERRSAEAALGALLGRRAGAPLGPALATPRLAAPEREAIEKAAIERSPELRSLRAALRREESRLELTEKNLKPDFMWEASYMNRGGLDPMVMGGVGVRLPLWRKQKQAEAVVQGRFELEAAQRDVAAGELKLLEAVRDLLARVERAETLLRLYGEGVIPQSRNALDSASASYSSGRADFLTLLDDFQGVLRYELDYETQRAEKIKALAALEALTGETFVQPAEAEDTAPSAGGRDE